MGGRDVEDLEVYKAARELRAAMYALAKELPAEEKFNLVSQIRRAALSITNNIAEGHGTYTFKQNIGYLHRARGSAYEIRDDLNLCEDQRYVPMERLDSIRQLANRVIMLIDGYIRYLRTRKPFRPQDGPHPDEGDDML